MTWLDAMVQEKIDEGFARDGSPEKLFGFDAVRATIGMVEDAITRRKAEAEAATQASIAAAVQRAATGKIGPIFAPMAKSMWETGFTLPAILRSSLLIAIYSQIEIVLLGLREALHEDLGLAAGVDRKTRDESIPHRRLRYIRDEARLPLGDFEKWSEWSKIDGYRLARNCLAHDGGVVRNPDHRAKIEALPNVEVTDLLMPLPVVHLLPGACEAAVDVAVGFLVKLLTALKSDPRFGAGPDGSAAKDVDARLG